MENELCMQEPAAITKSATSWRRVELADLLLACWRRTMPRRCLRGAWERAGSTSAPIRGRTSTTVLEAIAAPAITTFGEPEFVRMFGQVRRQSRDPCRRRVISTFLQSFCFHFLFEVLDHVSVVIEWSFSERILHSGCWLWCLASRNKGCCSRVELIRCHEEVNYQYL